MATASNNELLGVLGLAALIGAILVYTIPTTPVTVAVQPVVVEKPVVKPPHWGGVGPGWGGGRWLGEGDFKHFGAMDHPFRDPPQYSGHPQMPLPVHGRHGDMPQMPHMQPMPPMPPMMPPMGSSMGPTRH